MSTVASVKDTKSSQDVAFTKYMVWCAVIAAVSGVNVGWHISVPNMPQGVITKCTSGTHTDTSLPACLPMSDFTWGYTVGAYPLGGLFGGLISMYLNSRLGRRANMMIACSWMIFGGLLSSVSINLAMYAIGRAFTGISAGLSGSAVAIYISEIATSKSRGALGALFSLFLQLGVLLTQIAGVYMSYAPIWRLLWAIPTCIAAIQFVFIFFFTVESPRRLCAIRENEKAAEALQRLRAGYDITDEFEEILAARRYEESQKMMTVWDILLFKNRKITWHAIIVIVLQMYNQLGGIGPMSVYSFGFLTKVFRDDTLATNVVLAQSAANIVAAMFTALTMHKIGRKGFMLFSTACMCIASVFIVIGAALDDTTRLGPLVVTGSIFFNITYTLGCGIVPWIMPPELLPLRALAAGSALGSAANWVINFVINTVWPYMDSSMGNYSFTLFAAFNFIGFVFVAFCMPETTGKGIEGQDEDAISEKLDTVSEKCDDEKTV